MGLLAALTGGVIWARRAQLKQLPIPAVSVGLLAFLLIKFVDINMHGPTAIFTFVTPATLAMAVLLFAILKQLPIPAVSVGLLAFLLIKFVDINMHGPTAIFTFVTPATLAMAVLLFAIGGARFLQSKRQQR